jgi:DNA polymerase-3 subunit alpha
MLPLEIHIDVEFARGQEFVDYCRKVSDGLSWGNIHAFKMPLIDIISRVVKEVGLTWDCLRIPDDDRRVLELIGQGDIEKVFLLDYSPNALIMKFEEWAPDFVGNEKLKEYLQAQNIHSLRDLQNIMALWHPTSPAKIARIDRYKQAKSKPHKYEFLDAVQQAVLEPNFGLIIYHEDIIKLIELATGWDPVRCAIVRREMFLMTDHVDIQKFKETVDPEMAALILAEAPHTFCKSHIHSHGRFTEATAYLKAYHRDSYLSAVAQWEQEHGLMYDDIGVRLRNVSLLQN